jgi:hypothetical protein
MRRNGRLVCPVNQEEMKQVKIKAEEKEYSHVSDYLRFLIFEKDIIFQEKLFALEKKVDKVLNLLEQK